MKAEANGRKVRVVMAGNSSHYPENALIITRQTVAFNHDDNYWLDVEALESALAEDDPAREGLRAVREAVDLYRGEFLEGFSVR